MPTFLREYGKEKVQTTNHANGMSDESRSWYENPVSLKARTGSIPVLGTIWLSESLFKSLNMLIISILRLFVFWLIFALYFIHIREKIEKSSQYSSH